MMFSAPPMKNILVSWYGITDLRNSLGFVGSGPFLAAMKDTNYQQIHVLQYVDKNKIASEEELTLAALSLLSDMSQNEFINKVCNTHAANSYFLQWLQNKAIEENVHSDIVGHEVYLEKLNDSDGIYQAAVAILDEITTEPDIAVTLDISPGTAVMAFVWAFAALRYPGVNIRLITSPRSDCPPEEVPIPQGLRNQHERAVGRKLDECAELDVVYHHFGEQRMPSLLGVSEFPAKRHVFITTSSYSSAIMRDFVQDAEVEELRTDAFEADRCMADIGAHLSTIPARSTIAFNLTGGTKIMYACSLQLARKYNALPFYFDIANQRVINLLDFSHRPIKAHFTIPQIIHLNSSTRLKNCLTDGIPRENSKRRSLCKALYKEYRSIRRLYPVLADYSENREPFGQLESRKLTVELTKDYVALAKFSSGGSYSIPNWEDYAKFLAGGWFEEYVYHFVLLPLLTEGVINDARLNLELVEAGSPQGTYQEFDSVFTDGNRLYIIECKSGVVKGEHIEKLASVVRTYGGTSGKGILCYIGEVNSSVVLQKASAANIMLCHVDKLGEKIRTLLKR